MSGPQTSRPEHACAVLLLAFIVACSVPGPDPGRASTSRPGASAARATRGTPAADALGIQAPGPTSQEPRGSTAAGEAWLTLQVRDARTQLPIEGATISRARAKSWDDLAADVDATWSRLGITGSAPSWLALTREEALPPEPGTEEGAPFAPRDARLVATTGRDGRVVLSAKLPDEEFLVIDAAGRGPRYVGVAELAARASSRLDVDLHPLAKLAVRVRTLEGEPIEDAFVRVEAVPFLPEYRPQLARPLVDGLAWHGPTDARGKLELCALGADEAYVLTPLSRCIGKSATVVLTPGEVDADRDLIVIAPGSITGRLVGPDAQPLAGARVDCLPRRPWYSMSASATTDEDGCFSLNSLPCGTQPLHCTPNYKGGYAMMNAHPLEVQVEPFSRTDVGLLVHGERSSCTGRIIGLPPELEGEFNRTRLELAQALSRRMPEELKPDGSFRFAGQPGPAKLQLILATDWDSGRPILERTVLLPCEEVELDVASRLATLVFGLDAGADAELASATLYDHALDEADGIPAWQGALSRFDFDRDGERYVIRTLLPGRFRLELQLRGGARSWTGDVELEAGKTRDLGTIALGTASLSGTLAGAPPGSVVDFVRRVPGMFGKGAFGEREFDHRTAQVSDAGAFRLEELPAGLWCATATSGGAASLAPVLVDLRVGDSTTIALRASRAGSVRCRVRRGSTPVMGAVLSYSFARAESLRPFFELNPPLRLLPSGRDGVIEVRTLYPGPYRIDVELGDRRLSRAIQLAWGEERELDFDFGAPEFTLELHLPEDLLAQLFRVEYRTPDEAGANAGLCIPATRTGVRTFALRAPPSKGHAALLGQRDEQGATILIPLELREDRRRIELEFPAGEIALRVGNEAEHWRVPDVQAVELGGEKLPARDLWLSTLPLEQLPDGRWLARGVLPGSTVRIQPGDQRPRFGPPARLVRFESGRLELSWP